MPRRKVDPLRRRRVAQACDSCKRRKEKCSGGTPCGQCESRHREEACQYTKAQAPDVAKPLLREARGSSNHSESEDHHALCELDDLAPSETLKEGDNTVLNAAPEPKVSRMLRDIYVGESASLSFLQTVRRAVIVAVGPCEFTSDPLRHLMIETTPAVRFDSAHEPLLDLDEALSLADQFFQVVSGIMDLFDPAWLIDKLPTWVEDSSRREKLESPIIYLALAIGAQGRARDESDEIIAERCFGYGRQIATFTLMDDPSLLTVQSFILITYYMLAACRRNGAFTNLGVAVRAAYALGIHRHETNVAFVPQEGISRERAWKTLRVCDLFLSASMGRPPATSDTDCNIPWTSVDQVAGRESQHVPSQVASAIFRICHVFERILIEVYSRRAVSLDLAGSISRQHREWTEALPRMLKIDGLDEPVATRSLGLSHRLGCGVVTMAYYYSIILLSRPFLTFKVCHNAGNFSHGEAPSSSNTDLNTYADACVDSAIKGIDVAHETVYEQAMPQRQPFVINSVFISVLCLGLAYLDDYDRRGWPLSTGLRRGIAILNHFGRLNPQSARYSEICQLLQDATTTYVYNRDSKFLRSSSQQVRSVFGDIRHSAGGRSSVQPSNVDAGSNILRQQGIVEPISPSSFNDNTFQEESMNTMTGISTGQFSGGHNYRLHDDSQFTVLPLNFFSANGALLSDDWPTEDDVPLFSLTSEVTSEMYNW
ncbi:fungal specific transcription factor domain protein [Rutstroemia sp. NJR-2017a BBW]|nr:fungal specific transcription factor domain protein [Rutstroemia sp. NJR-2017a BBW]